MLKILFLQISMLMLDFFHHGKAIQVCKLYGQHYLVRVLKLIQLRLTVSTSELLSR
jgi:hypothetical protein